MFILTKKIFKANISLYFYAFLGLNILILILKFLFSINFFLLKIFYFLHVMPEINVKAKIFNFYINLFTANFNLNLNLFNTGPFNSDQYTFKVLH